MDRLEQLLLHLSKEDQKIMAGLSDIKAALDAEKADLATLATQVTQLLAAFASGTLSPADAQALLDEINGDDSSVKTSIAAISAALPPAATV